MHTCSPAVVRISVLVVIIDRLPTDLIPLIVVCAVTTSPGRSGREYWNCCSPCTTIA